MKIVPVLIGIAFASSIAMNTKAQAQDNYYQEAPIFMPHPKPGSKKGWPITNFDPAGLGFQLTDPAFTIKVAEIHKGSPAAKTGKFKKGQVIDLIMGEARKMTTTTIGGTDYLLIENGGFDAGSPKAADWTPPYIVFVRVK